MIHAFFAALALPLLLATSALAATPEQCGDADLSGSRTGTDGVAALRLAAGLPATTACASTVVDRSGFTVFDFSHRLSFGYCPRIGKPSRLILVESNDQLFLDGTIIVAGNAGDPDCLPDVMPVPAAACVKAMTIPTRILTAEEETRVRNAFTAVALEEEQNPDCGKVPIEPCLIEDFKWDDFEVTDFACGEPHLPPDQAAALDTLLQSLL